ncbi:hypothetical protein Tco_0630228 [Tanacetum coccineum]
MRRMENSYSGISIQEVTSIKFVPSCFVILDLEPLSLSFDFVFNLEIFKSLSLISLSSLPSCDLVSWLVPSCCMIFDLEPLSLSFDFVFNLEIFKSLSLRSLSSFPSCDLVSWYQHAHHLESLITISLDTLYLDNLDIFKEDLENQSPRKTLVTCT